MRKKNIKCVKGQVSDITLKQKQQRAGYALVTCPYLFLPFSGFNNYLFSHDSPYCPGRGSESIMLSEARPCS